MLRAIDKTLFQSTLEIGPLITDEIRIAVSTSLEISSKNFLIHKLQESPYIKIQVPIRYLIF